ncbi:hypothetical protein RSAG8_11068, partial [Rhizoctonia solani AG-8 WAC10335]
MFQPQQSIGAAMAGGSQSPGEVNSPAFLSSEPAAFVAGARTPPERTGTSKRKQTLLALIDELTELRDEELEREREISYGLTKDERTSSDAEGIERFQAFDKCIRSLDLKLQSFANAVRQLGSSVGLLNAAYHLRARLRQIQYFFWENAAELFDAIPHAPNVGTSRYSARKRGKVRRHMAVGPENTLWSTEIEELPDEMENLATDLDKFLKRLNDVPEFTDEAVNASIVAFEGDLRYRASCLREFKDQLRFLAVARYINDLTEDLGEHMESMMESLNTFIDVGVPTIRFSQKHTATGLQNLSTVATFFSGVTATTLQFSFEAKDNVAQNLVNGLWISSLVFSIASAINSQLAYHWRAAMYRSPRCYVPWWVSIWITRTPLFFLVGSVIAFSAGLCVFTYSSSQAAAVSAVVTTFTVVTSSALSPTEQLQRNAKFKALTKRPHTHPPSSPPIRSMSSPSVMSDPRHRRDSSEHELIPARIQTYVPMLRTLRFSQLLTEHVALVKHLQFSPDGQFLATCSWDRTALIWRVGAGPQGDFELLHKLAHTTRLGGFVGQVAWSPNGEQLLTKQIKSIKVWGSKNGVCERTIDRKRTVQAITWMPKGSRFLSIEWKMDSSQGDKRVHHTENILGSDLVVVGTDGVQHQEHHLPRLQVWDAAVVPDEERLVAVATLIRSGQDRRPVKSRPEKRILIYNLQTKEIENQVPLLQDVRDVTLTEEGNYALVSYENKAPPQAWRIDKILREGKQRLVLAHTYFTKHPVDFAGPSYFGGVKDTFVLAASKSGEIYIWERSSGVLLHSLKAPDQELTNLAWNHKASSGFMFASAAHDGMVRIWTTTAAAPPRSRVPSPEPQEVESPGLLHQGHFVGSPPGSPPGSPRLF